MMCKMEKKRIWGKTYGHTQEENNSFFLGKEVGEVKEGYTAQIVTG